MSRTDKDRPEWVQENDFTLKMGYRHDHMKFGLAKDWFGEDLRYISHCTMFEQIPVKPVYDGGYIYISQEDNRIHKASPCERFVEHMMRPFKNFPYQSRVVRSKERDFLKAEVKRYNSGYMDGDEYLMDEEVFSTRRYGVQGKGW